MPPAKKAAASKTTSTRRWASKNATTAAVTKFEEDFAKSMGTSLRLGAKREKAEIVTTGSMALDYALGVGGVPTGRIVEFWGPEHAGKTTANILMARQFQMRYPKKVIAWVDMEQTFDDDWAEECGLDLSRMWFYTPKTAEDVADAVKRFVASGMCSFVSLDSVGGMISRIEMEKEADEATVGKVPGIVTRMVKAASPMAFANGTTLSVVNQVRANIGGWGPDEDTGGGWALKHVTTMKVQVRRQGGQGTTHSEKDPFTGDPVEVGHKIAFRVQKNKMAPAGKVAEVWFHNVPTEAYGPVGYNLAGEVFAFAKRFSAMGTKAGGYYLMPSGEEVRGEPAALDYLNTHPEEVSVLREKVLAGLKSAEVIPDAPGVTEDESDDPSGMGEMVG